MEGGISARAAARNMSGLQEALSRGKKEEQSGPVLMSESKVILTKGRKHWKEMAK